MNRTDRRFQFVLRFEGMSTPWSSVLGLLLVFPLLLVATQDAPDPCREVKHGDEFMVGLYFANGNKCEGVLVSENTFIVSNAKCFAETSQQDFINWNISFAHETQQHQVARVEQVKYISVIKFTPSLDFSSPDIKVRPICLPNDHIEISDADSCKNENDPPELYYCRAKQCGTQDWDVNTDEDVPVLVGVNDFTCSSNSDEISFFKIFTIKEQILVKQATEVPPTKLFVPTIGNRNPNIRTETPRIYSRKFQNICPIIDLGIRDFICDKSGRKQVGEMRLAPGQNCSAAKILNNRVICLNSGETLDIFCKIKNDEYITLVVAQEICRRTFFESNELPETQTETTTTTVEVDENSAQRELKTCQTIVPGKECQFPFWMENQLRFECVQAGIGGRPFSCPTKLNEKTLEAVEWADCNTTSCPLMNFHSHQDLINDLDKIAIAFPNHAKTFRIGKSVNELDLQGIRLSKDIGSFGNRSGNIGLRPMVKMVGNMHGNEPTGRELIIHLAKYILLAASLKDDPEYQNFTQNLKVQVDRAAKILESTDLWILPTMNPDGFERASEGECFGGRYTDGRQNEGRQDLNRNFPSYDDLELLQGENPNSIFDYRENETKLMMRWILDYPFVLSVNFHDGAVLANYPFDDYHNKPDRLGPNATPDNDVFLHLAFTYTKNHATMNNGTEDCGQWGPFENATTNGAEWYEVVGGMQDFNYLFSNAMELTMELSCCKYPHRDRLLPEWNNNIKSLIIYVEQAQRGIKGVVTNSQNETEANAFVRIAKVNEFESNPDVAKIDWRAKDIKTSSEGKYWRILVPGKYYVQVVNEDKSRVSEIAQVEVKDSLEPEVVNFVLQNSFQRTNRGRNLRSRIAKTKTNNRSSLIKFL